MSHLTSCSSPLFLCATPKHCPLLWWVIIFLFPRTQQCPDHKHLEFLLRILGSIKNLLILVICSLSFSFMYTLIVLIPKISYFLCCPSQFLTAHLSILMAFCFVCVPINEMRAISVIIIVWDCPLEHTGLISGYKTGTLALAP